MKTLLLFIQLLVITITCKSQDITLTGSVEVPQSGYKITLSGNNIHLKKINLTCFELVINADVSSITLVGDVKIVCKKLTNNQAGTIQLIATGRASLTIEKPRDTPNIHFNNTSSQFIETVWKPINDK